LTALTSLYSLTGPAREQEVSTPQWILDAAAEAMGSIWIDPCAHSDLSRHFAQLNFMLSDYGQELQRALRVLQGDEAKAVQKELQGEYRKGSLVLDWTAWDRVFINPIYSDLEVWMEKACTVGGSCVQLIPVRPHRQWWPRCAKGWQCVYLAPFAFVGSKDSFPAPLCLLAKNCTIPDLGKRETYRCSI
jgi:hypothetical protein